MGRKMRNYVIMFELLQGRPNIRITLLVTASMKEAVENLAEKNGQGVNKEIRHLLAQAIAAKAAADRG